MNLRVSDLLHAYTTSALEATYEYEVRLLCVRDLCFKVFLDCINVAMTVDGIQLQGCDDGRWSIRLFFDRVVTVDGVLDCSLTV